MSIESRAKKLLALAERGVGGEKANAQRMLDKLLEKHSLTLDDLIGEQRKDHLFECSGGAIYKRLLLQIIVSVMPLKTDIYHCRGKRNAYIVSATDAEIVEIELMYDVYSVALKEQLDITFQAFIHKHDIFNRDTKTERGPGMDEERLQQIANMIFAMPKTHIHQRLEDSCNPSTPDTE